MKRAFKIFILISLSVTVIFGGIIAFQENSRPYSIKFPVKLSSQERMIFVKAINGHTDSQIKWAGWLWKGTLGFTNRKDAEYWLKEARKLGDTSALFEWGIWMGKEDDFESSRLIEVAAHDGNLEAQLFLAMRHGLGEFHVNPNPDHERLSAYWSKQAAMQGDAGSQFRTGLHYIYAKGAEQNYEAGVNWLLKAAQQGEANAQFELSELASTGRGIPLNLVIAYMWANISAANGSDEARSLRSKLESTMSAVQIREAQEKSLLCQRTDYTECS